MKEYKIYLIFSIALFIFLILFSSMFVKCIYGGETNWRNRVYGAFPIYFKNVFWYQNTSSFQMNIFTFLLFMPLLGISCVEGFKGHLIILTFFFSIIYYNFILFIIIRLIKMSKKYLFKSSSSSV